MSAAAVVTVVAGVVLFTGGRLAALTAGAGHAIDNAFGAAGFRLTSLQVAGASPDAAEDIAAATGLDDGHPMLGLDLAAVRERVLQVGWVEEASVQRLLPGTVRISVVERAPVAVWSINGLQRVIDAEGRVIGEADPQRFAELPLIVGPHANEADPAIFEQLRARPRLTERTEALVRVDGRRWDIRLKSGAIILLPATEIESALLRLDQLDQGQRVLDLGFERIDLRSPEMVVVRRVGDSPVPPPAASTPASGDA